MTTPCRLRPDSDLLPLSRARLRASSHRGADAILRLHTIPPAVALDDFAATFYILHRLGIPLSHYFSLADLATCSPACPSLPPHKPLTPAHSLHYQLLHAYHQAACGCDDSRFARHEAIAATLAAWHSNRRAPSALT